MNTAFRTSFLRDVKRVRDRRVLDQIRAAIEGIEAAATLGDLPDVRKLSGASGFYRVRIGDYRIGLVVDGETVEFVRVLHRREVYRYFP